MHPVEKAPGKIFVPLVEGDFESELLPYRYRDTYMVEATQGGPDRLLIGPAHDHVPLLLHLAKGVLGDPVALIYVLVKALPPHRSGRYYSPQPLSQADLERFLTRYGAFLAHDGRHHLWLIDAHRPEVFLVYDRHDVLYAYGDQARFRTLLDSWGLRAANVEYPGHHAHAYDHQHDAIGAQLLAELAWEHGPLIGNDAD